MIIIIKKTSPIRLVFENIFFDSPYRIAVFKNIYSIVLVRSFTNFEKKFLFVNSQTYVSDKCFFNISYSA